MAFIVSLKKASFDVVHKAQSYEGDGFYAHQTYRDESYLFKASPFTWLPQQAVGIIGKDEQGILKDTLLKLHQEEVEMYSSSEKYPIIDFEDRKAFYSYIRRYKDVETPPNITQVCFGAEIEKKGKAYNLLLHSNQVSGTDKAPFEQGDTIPKLFGGYNELKSSHISTFTMAVSEIIASKYNNEVEHQFHVAFVPRKTGEFKQNYFSAGMSQTFSPLVVVIFLIPFMNFFQKALEEKVNRIREYMRMMGMKDSAYNISWAIYYTLQIILVWSEMSIITYLYLLPKSSFILIFAFYFMYGISLFGFILSLVALFNNKKTGSAAGIIIHFATFYIAHAIPKSAGIYTRLLASLVPNIAMSQGVETLWKLEDNEMGLNFGTMAHLHKNFNMTNYYIMCLINTVLYTLIGIYLTYVSIITK